MSQIDDTLSATNNHPSAAVKYEARLMQAAIRDYQRGMRSLSTHPVYERSTGKETDDAIWRRMNKYHIDYLGGGADTGVFKHLGKGKKPDFVGKVPRLVSKVDRFHQKVDLERDFLGAVSSIVLGKTLPQYFPETEIITEENIFASSGKSVIFFQPFIPGKAPQYWVDETTPEGTPERKMYDELTKVLPSMGMRVGDLGSKPRMVKGKKKGGPHNLIQTPEGKIVSMDTSRFTWDIHRNRGAKDLFMDAANRVLSISQKGQLNAFAREKGLNISFGPQREPSKQMGFHKPRQEGLIQEKGHRTRKAKGLE